jgi:hypothetical protein
MTDVIDFIERLGQDSGLRYASGQVVDRVLSEAQFSPEMRIALASRDQSLLESLLGATTNVCCLINAPLGEEEENAKPVKANEEKGKGGESIASQLRLSRVA